MPKQDPSTVGTDGATSKPDTEEFGVVDKVPRLREKRARGIDKDWMRGILAGALTLIFGVTVIWALTTASTWSEMSELLNVILPAITGLLGSAAGFYFGSRAGE